jgi:hypothetical protein
MSRAAAQSGPRFRVLGSESGYRSYGLDSQEPALKSGMLPDNPEFGTTPESDWGGLGIDGDGGGSGQRVGRQIAFMHESRHFASNSDLEYRFSVGVAPRKGLPPCGGWGR